MHDYLFIIGFLLFNAGLYYNFGVIACLLFSGAALMIIGILLARAKLDAGKAIQSTDTTK